jgi:molecular chaperone DnaJ
MSKRDYYETLGVSKNASPEELKTAFRRLAREYHPDVSERADAEERFKEVNEAFGVLSDDDKRAAYDRYGHAGVNGMGGFPDFTVNFSDIFEELFNFGGGRGRGRRNAPRRGANLRYTVNLDFEEAVFGVDKEIEFPRDEVCSHCEGARAEPGTGKSQCPTCKGAGEVRQARQSLFGSMVQVSTCPTCRGEGETIETLCKVCNGRGLERKTIKKAVEIPGGVDNGTQIRLNGEGQPGINGGPNGNLYLMVQVRRHKFFKRRDNDILLDLDINIAQATLGAEVEVPTVDGKASLKIPTGIQPGKVLRMRGKGIPHIRGKGRGDQLVIINVKVPKRISPEQRELFEQLADSLGSEVSPQESGFFDRLRDFLGG